jgi:hypothetical protein
MAVKQSRAVKAVKMALDAVRAGKLATDAKDDEIKKTIAGCDDYDDEDAMDEKEDDFVEGEIDKKSDAKDKAAKDKAAKNKAAKDEDNDDEKDDEKDKKKDEKAMDQAVSSAVSKMRAEMHAATEAVRFVRPWVGDLAVAQDSAEGVFKAALDLMGVKTEGLHPSAYRHVLEAQPRPGAGRAPMAADSAKAGASLAARFPYLAKIRQA